MTQLDLRPSPIAGTWYEGNPDKLSKTIDEYLHRVQLPKMDGEVVAVIAPHAGHRYSGQIAAHAFVSLRRLNPELVAIISPFHAFAPHPLITTSHDAYHTPLGNIEVDQISLKQLQDKLDMAITPLANDKEHSLEIELPFLQRVLKNEFKLLPIMIRAQEPEVAKELGNALVNVLKNKKALLVASTDLSHFYEQKTANLLDQEMLRRFESFDPDLIFEAEHSGKAFACGHAAVATVLYASRALGANKVTVVKYATSGDITGEYSSVVGYGAAIITKPI